MGRLGPILLWSGLVLLLDQASKLYLASQVPLNTGFALTSFFNLVHVRNPGVAFGLLSGVGGRYLMIGLTLAALAGLFFLVFRVVPRSRWTGPAMGLVLGGALGNLIDRLRFGQVTDFLDFHLNDYHWPVFNLADSALTCGFILLGLIIIRRA